MEHIDGRTATSPAETGRGSALLSGIAAGLASSSVGCAIASIWLMGGLFPLAMVLLIAYPAVVIVPLSFLTTAFSNRSSRDRLLLMAPGVITVVLGVLEILLLPVDEVLPGLLLASGLCTMFTLRRLVRYFTRRPVQRIAVLIIGASAFLFSAWRLGLFIHTFPLIAL